ncbi:MAG: Glyoxalase/bleomycin resistance protein/dioxygenase [Modestobacter sp.]|jgi:predicted enzyme related to lactoylglutathione lyase|nr:Glyoxalase/bleomycin resistance protein/dioxygenase [Modestobacter sp.]MCW2575623.1 Glyoxalase/bleomycin resistance protein/dioxygenase [Modestobacter sp.]MCW2616982.1 Glyoxalase/bleomycin resistance protein/dioxygenase [Modestobacter sp.]
MPSTVQPILVTRDLERLSTFYRSLFDAVETERVPADGPTFYVGLRIGECDLGLVNDGEAPDGPQRMLLSVEVPDVDGLLPRVAALGGVVPGPSNDMPWGQRVAHVRDPDGNNVNLTQQLSPPSGGR